MLEAMQDRHSVRSYKDIQIPSEKRDVLNKLINDINEETGLHIQIFYDEPHCFNSMMAHYGKFSGVANYISLVGPKSKCLDEKLGYYGEKLVLKAQELGLNSCWVALTHGKSKADIASGEKERCLIALGYGESQGVTHNSKSIKTLSNYDANKPDWFKAGVEAAMLAPTAVNQQKFYLELTSNGQVKATKGTSFYTGIDLGIVKYHFELGSGKDNSIWQ